MKAAITYLTHFMVYLLRFTMIYTAGTKFTVFLGTDVTNPSIIISSN